MTPCSSCGSFVLGAGACPHCGARSGLAIAPTAAMVLLGLAVGCPRTLEPHYGSAVPSGDPTWTPEPQTSDCSEYEFEGELYDCTALDRCDPSEDTIKYRLACCDCDAALCDPDPSCDTGA